MPKVTPDCRADGIAVERGGADDDAPARIAGVAMKNGFERIRQWRAIAASTDRPNKGAP